MRRREFATSRSAREVPPSFPRSEGEGRTSALVPLGVLELAEGHVCEARWGTSAEPLEPWCAASRGRSGERPIGPRALGGGKGRAEDAPQ